MQGVGNGFDAMEVVGGKFENDEAAIHEVLLVADVLVGGEIEFACGEPEAFCVFSTTPAATPRGIASAKRHDAVHP